MIIENFAELSEKEQRDFAETLVKTINSEKTFLTEDTSYVEFEITNVRAWDIDGSLDISVVSDDYVVLECKADWTAANEDDMYDDPGYDAEYDVDELDAASKIFKQKTVEINGYSVTFDVQDTDEVEPPEIEVDTYHHDDAGIGSYEYWGVPGYDSHPYVAVSGTLYKHCKVNCSISVEPLQPQPETEAEPER